MKVQVLQNTIVITSSLKVEEIVALQETNQEYLSLFDENKDPIFSIFYHEGYSNFSKHGITFGSENSDGFATATVTLNVITTEVKKTVAKKLREVLINLPKIEEQVKAAVEELELEISELENIIEVLG